MTAPGVTPNLPFDSLFSELLVRKSMLSCVAGAALMLCSTLASADTFHDRIDDTPSAGEMVFDLLIVRPVALVGTVLGTGLFIVSLPLTAIQGDVEGPAKRLVGQPLEYTFTRPLGAMQ